MVLCIPARLALVVAVWVQAAVARSISEPHGDPSGSWLSYAEFAAGRKITGMNATVVVPSTPTNTRMGSNPSFWYGLQTAAADGALIQPILAWHQRGDGFSIFLEVFDWTNEEDHQSEEAFTVPPGDTLTQSVSYQAADNSYDMVITSKALGKSIRMNYALLSKQTADETTAFIVVEHAPEKCDQYPPNGNVTFTDISIAVEGRLVTPTWTPKQMNPACSSRAIAQSDGSVALTWVPQ